MTLRDELEQKLRGIYVKSQNDVFGEIADEVIRQMEWARAKAEQGNVKGISPLTLAPPEWKP